MEDPLIHTTTKRQYSLVVPDQPKYGYQRLIDSVSMRCHCFLAFPALGKAQAWLSVLPDSDLVVDLTLWNVSSSDDWDMTTGTGFQNLSAKVPGDLLTDLLHAGVIQDPYFNRDFLTQSHVWMGPRRHDKDQERTRTWTYSTQFTIPDATNATYFLVAESIKMGARVQLNGVVVGLASNQFRRYLFHLTAEALLRGALQPGGNRRHELEIVFDPSISTNGRFMACSGGWDWAPYVRSTNCATCTRMQIFLLFSLSLS